MLSKKQEFLLQKVQKPARYIGGEVNSVVKDKSKIKFRYAFCFPDNYEIGMSHLGMKILYRDRKSTRLNSSHLEQSRMPSSA